MGDRKSSGCLGVIGALFLIACLFAMIMAAISHTRTDNPNPPARTPTPTTSNPATEETPAPDLGNPELAFYAGEEVCKKALKAPSTAKFSRYNLDDDTGHENWGYKQWKVFGHVDSQNSFGAMLRENWLAVVQENDGIYQVVYFRFAGEETGPMPDMRSAPQPPLTPEQIAAQRAKEDAAKKSNTDRALQRNQADADKGDAYGLLRMGERYRDGEGVEKDLAKAREYLAKAVAAGSSSAQEELDQLPK